MQVSYFCIENACFLGIVAQDNRLHHGKKEQNPGLPKENNVFKNANLCLKFHNNVSNLVRTSLEYHQIF